MMLCTMLFLMQTLLHGACNPSSSVQPLSIIEECFDTIKFSESEAKSTIKTVTQVFNDYSFVDHLRDPPVDGGVSKMDLVALVEALDLKELNTTFKFYSALVKLVDSARDAHLQFVAPCDTIIMQAFPYDLSIDTTSTPTLVLKEFTAAAGLSDYSNDQVGFNLVGAKVTNLTLTDDFDAGKTPFDVLSEWAEENVAFAKRKTNRFNRAIAESFVIRRALKPQTKQVKMMVTLTGGEQKTVTVPLVALINTKDKLTDLEKLCPIKSSKANMFEEAPKLSVEEIKEKNEELLQDILSPSRTIVTEKPSPKQLPQSNSDYYTPIVTSESSITSGVISSEKTGYLHIGSFGQNQITTAKAYVQSLKGIVDKKCEKFILDLRGNGGGDVTMMVQMMELLWPNAIPHTFEVDNQVTTWRELYHKFMLTSTSAPVDKITFEPIDVSKDPIEKTFKHVNGTEYKRTFTKRYSFGGGNDFVWATAKKNWNKDQLTRTTPLFTPENTIILTDGMCGSACGMFIKNARIHRLGRVMYLGGYPITTDPTDVDIGEFSGGSVFPVSNVIAVAQHMKEDSPMDAFVRETVDMTFTHTIAYSTEAGKEDELMEFSRVTPSLVKRLYKKAPSTSEADVKELVGLVKAEFGKCDEGMFQQSATCNKQNKDNELFAHPCSPATGTYDTSTCVAAGCVDRYWSVYGKCVAVPTFSRAPVDLRSWFGKYGWIIILVIILVVAAVVGVIIICCCCCRRNNKSNSGSYDRA
ncbi:hypothetical protein BLNAU_10227 [Blattamonas nauphoetae]|uniref:Tail specific protease domain-containing protein n=1 Tax=Blattamonas nauphoetae TaxID=2049346 RepID=A0ABQ9XTU8_9EUKA|nr:hypothetical protein BLNAU_10227 [Blattamonas nauphoetae]